MDFIHCQIARLVLTVDTSHLLHKGRLLAIMSTAPKASHVGRPSRNTGIAAGQVADGEIDCMLSNLDKTEEPEKLGELPIIVCPQVCGTH